jgi:hypothetical protein
VINFALKRARRNDIRLVDQKNLNKIVDWSV